MNHKIILHKEASKCGTAAMLILLTCIASFMLCLFANPNVGHTQSAAKENSCTILQNIKAFCKQPSLKKSKKNKHVNGPSLAKRQGIFSDEASLWSIAPTVGHQPSEVILDAYEKIEDFYAYDPLEKKWVQIKSFKIINGCCNANPLDLTVDGNPYANFWAYDLPNETWHSVSLIPYLQQANTQINSDSPAIATKESVLPSHNNPLNDVAADTLLEELLGVHTAIKPNHPEQKASIWANFSFDFSIGAGAVFYSNRLEQMRLLQREKGEYFFITKTNEVYKPNWFHHTLNRVTHFDPLYGVEHGNTDNTTFQGKGFGLPITLGIQYVFWERLLLGFGREIVFNATTKLSHNDDIISNKTYKIDKKWSTQGRWFGKCGWYLLHNTKHRLFGDIHLFYLQHLGHMSPTLITFGPYLHEALAYNFGLGYEQQLTDHLSYTVRLSMEQQGFKQFSSKESYGYNIQYRQPAIYLQVGLSIRPTKYNLSKHLTNQANQYKNHTLSDALTAEGLQNLLDLD